MSLSTIRVEDQVFAAEGQVGIGADHLTVYIEGYGDTRIGPEQIASAHDGKVVLNLRALPDDLLARIAHVHDGELRRPSDS